MQPVRPETLAFLAPGLLHQLGNILFTVQGNAQAWNGAGDPSRERAAILHAAERGSHTLRVLRCLLGDPAALPAAANDLLQQLGELLRVPVREARHMLELRCSADESGAPAVAVDPPDFCTMIVEAVRSLLAVVPAGVHGTVVLDLCSQTSRKTTVRVLFQPPSGALPFPLAGAELLERMRPSDLNLRGRPAVAAHAMGLEIVFGTRGGVREAEV
ncbi:MAG: hypothetical protein IT456_07080 [Planctomycetes bacterium]|nr:hypothetical protein [Planctomycetota bacterium]